MNLSFDDGYEEIPEHMRAAMLSYVQIGHLTGDFLHAVVSNDLGGAVGRADPQNLPLIPLYVRWFYNRAPAVCHGSIDIVNAWIDRGGLRTAA